MIKITEPMTPKEALGIVISKTWALVADANIDGRVEEAAINTELVTTLEALQSSLFVDKSITTVDVYRIYVDDSGYMLHQKFYSGTKEDIEAFFEAVKRVHTQVHLSKLDITTVNTNTALTYAQNVTNLSDRIEQQRKIFEEMKMLEQSTKLW